MLIFASFVLIIETFFFACGPIEIEIIFLISLFDTIEETLTSPNTPGQSRSESNDTERGAPRSPDIQN